jgi:hypothetical protein
MQPALSVGRFMIDLTRGKAPITNQQKSEDLFMKRLLALMMTLAMALSLVACGGVDKTAVTEAFNNTNTELNTVVTFANDNLDKMDQATMDSLQNIINSMAAFKAEIESDDLSEDRADEIIAELKNYPAKIAEMKSKVDTLIESGSAGMTEEQLATLVQLTQGIVDIYNKFAEYYDSFDDETKGKIDEIGLAVDELNSVLDGSVVLDSAQAETVIKANQEFLAEIEAGWAEVEPQLAE